MDSKEVIARVGTHLNFRIQQMQFEKDNADLQMEKEKRAAELIIANREIAQKTKELLLAREQIEVASIIISRAWRYNKSLIEASIDPIITIDKDGMAADILMD